MPPLIYFVCPVDTPCSTIFLEKVKRHQQAALESKIIVLTCDQTWPDIKKNNQRITTEKPDVVILASSMDESPFMGYSKLILENRKTIRDSNQAKPLIYHYDNQFSVLPEKYLKDDVDEYFSTLGELISALINYQK
jgi:hypothetical protein